MLVAPRYLMMMSWDGCSEPFPTERRECMPSSAIFRSSSTVVVKAVSERASFLASLARCLGVQILPGRFTSSRVRFAPCPVALPARTLRRATPMLHRSPGDMLTRFSERDGFLRLFRVWLYW